MSEQSNVDDINPLSNAIAKNVGIALNVITIMLKGLRAQPNFDNQKFNKDILELSEKVTDEDLKKFLIEVLQISSDD